MNPLRAHRAYGVYVHIPFCASKCPYCDFVSGRVSDVRRKSYLAALQGEVLDSPYFGSEAETLYLGGGTPSELRAAELDEILETLSKAFSFSGDSEWTIECNPNSATKSFLGGAKDSGFSRLSLGVQSFSNKHLRRLGRLHQAGDTFKAYDSARKSGFEQINVDLIFAIPGQTLEEWREDLETAVSLAPEHLSLYSLTIESNSEFGRLVQSRLLKPVKSDLSADMFELAMDLTAKAGYQHYEISNYALKSYECRHNLRYWRNEPYLGFGLGAASFDDGVRWTNTSDWDSYERSLLSGSVIRATEEKLTNQHALAEEVMLRLRTRWGFSPKTLSEKYDSDFWLLLGDSVEFFRREALLDVSEDNLRLTRKGILLADEICATILQSLKDVCVGSS